MKAAIITFHGAHNYGAVLQAYALQQYCLSKGMECEIIDYRSIQQKDFNSLYPRRNGLKSIVKNMLMLPYHSKRRIREKKFEDFVKQKLYLTKQTYVTEKNLYELNEMADVFIAGSDQIWNTTQSADTSKAYFLDFAGDEKKKIAYAASIGTAKKEDLLDYVDLLRRFDAISCRERRAAEVISELSQKEISVVLDPTLLVDRTVFQRLIDNVAPKFKDYIFYYSLDGYNQRKNNVQELRALGKRLGKKIVSLTPEWPKLEKDFINVIDAGLIEFLAFINYADLICTNSFHGAALSISFQKDFLVLDRYDGKDDRKINILKQLQLEDRMIKDVKHMEKMDIPSIDYKKVNSLIEKWREQSSFFLEQAMKLEV